MTAVNVENIVKAVNAVRAAVASRGQNLAAQKVYVDTTMFEE